MAYSSIPSSWIEAGKALKKRILRTISDNLEDHETRINNVEAGVGKVELFNFEVMGFINNYRASELVQIGTHRAPNNYTITEAKLILMNGSSSLQSSNDGILQIDLEKSEDDGVTWNTILQERPSIPDGVNSTGTESSLFSFVSGGESVNKDDIIRVNVTSKKDTQGSFLILVYGDLS